VLGLFDHLGHADDVSLSVETVKGGRLGIELITEDEDDLSSRLAVRRGWGRLSIVPATGAPRAIPGGPARPDARAHKRLTKLAHETIVAAKRQSVKPRLPGDRVLSFSSLR
jgi:hypothetical protein